MPLMLSLKIAAPTGARKYLTGALLVLCEAALDHGDRDPRRNGCAGLSSWLGLTGHDHGAAARNRDFFAHRIVARPGVSGTVIFASIHQIL
jgi:hypothetical protein